MLVKNQAIYKLLKESIYHIETQCDNITRDIVEKEANKLKEKLINYNYPGNTIDEAIIEFTQYFQHNMDV